VTFGPSAHGDTPPPLRHADVLNGWSLMQICKRMQLLIGTVFCYSKQAIPILVWHSSAMRCGKTFSTGCKRRIRKMFEFKIWKESMLVLKQTTHQQKVLDLSFNVAP